MPCNSSCKRKLSIDIVGICGRVDLLLWVCDGLSKQSESGCNICGILEPEPTHSDYMPHDLLHLPNCFQLFVRPELRRNRILDYGGQNDYHTGAYRNGDPHRHRAFN